MVLPRVRERALARPQGYKDFDSGTAKKFVIDPHGSLGEGRIDGDFQLRKRCEMKTERPKADDDRPLSPKIVDVTHASKESAAFFHSFFTAKSRHDVDATMNHFSKSTLTYIDATLGWSFCPRPQDTVGATS